MPHFSNTLPDAAFAVAYFASTREKPTSPKRKASTAVSASVMTPRPQNACARQYPSSARSERMSAATTERSPMTSPVSRHTSAQ